MNITKIFSLLSAALLFEACYVDVFEMGSSSSVYYSEMYSSSLAHSSSSVEIKLQDSLRYQEQSYKLVQVGDLIWMAQNLNAPPKKGNSWCAKTEKYCEQNGRFYDWEAATNVCPDTSGWRLPSKNDFDKLSDDLSGNENLIESPAWWNATYEGYRDENSGDYPTMSQQGYWWSSTTSENDNSRAYYRFIKKGDQLLSNDEAKTRGFSVRCVKKP